MSKVVIQLVAWNGVKYLSPLFASLRNQTYLAKGECTSGAKDWQLLIWDNGSTDGTASLIEKELSDGWCQYEITKSDKNIGFAPAHNKLFNLSSKLQAPSYIFLLNQDTVLEPDYIEKLVVFMGAHPEAGAVSGKIMRVDDKTRVDSMGLKLRLSGRVVELKKGGGEPFEVFGVSGALPMYRIAAIEKVGFFDESFFSYKEDVDLAYRLRRAGFKAYCVPQAIAYHARSAGTVGGLVRAVQEHHNRSELTNFYSYRNHILVLLKNLGWKDAWRLPFIFVYEAAKFFYLLAFNPKILFKAWKDIIRFLLW